MELAFPNGVGFTLSLYSDPITSHYFWQWLRNPAAKLENGSSIDSARYRTERSRILDDLLRQADAGESAHLVKAAELLDRLVLNDEFATFLTLDAYQAIC